MSHRLPFHQVAAEEMALIRKRREKFGGREPLKFRDSTLDQDLKGRLDSAANDDSRLKACRLVALDRHHAGLAFSGGGIRSATFAVGILQGLASLGLIRRFDYLSTVSGGGYAGGWLAAWLKRDGDPSNVEAQLSPGRVANARANRDEWGELLPPGEVIDEEPEPIFHLREYSSYLTPQPGLMSADTWTIIAIWLRNVLINLLILLPATILVVLLARFVVFLCAAFWTHERTHDRPEWYVIGIYALGLLLMIGSFVVNALAVENFRRRSIEGRERHRGWFIGPKLTTYAIVSTQLAAMVLVTISFRKVVPWLASMSVVDSLLDQVDIDETLKIGYFLRRILTYSVYLGGIVGGLSVAIGLGFGTFRWRLVRAATLAGMSGGLFAAFFEVWVDQLQHYRHGAEVATFIPAIGMVGAVLTIFIQVALLGRSIGKAEREWWGRITGLMLIAAIGWVVAMGSILFVPVGFLYGGSNLSRIALTAGWLGTTASGIVAARNVMSRMNAKGGSLPLSVVASVAPPIFLVGLLGACSLLSDFLLRELQKNADTSHVAASGPEWQAYYVGLANKDNLVPLVQLASLAFLATSMGLYLIDVNLFSLHAMYANRLTRAYLGASRPKRRWEGRWGPNRERFEGGGGPSRTSPPPRDQNPVTGFDADDDIPLMDLKIGEGPAGSAYWGPHLLINTSLNMVGGDELAWRNRKSESFVLTPLYCGSKGTGFAQLAVETKNQELSERRTRLEARRDRVARYKTTLLDRWWVNKSRRVELACDTSTDENLDRERVRLDLEWATLDLRRGRLIRLEEGQAREQMRLDRKVDPKQLTLGRAIAISGAAVDPNMNIYQSPALTALLTIFNFRLGYWMQNPFHPGWSAKGPIYGSLLRDEFFGETNDKGKFVHLSDGGHFENLGVYELIRRRCRYVVACDAGEDGTPSDENLANLVRLCRTDFGVRIQLNTTPLRMSPGERLTPVHVVIGRICYDDVDRGEMPGILVYIKISLSGDEPSDTQNYAALHPEFPHQSTDLRQSFDEAQFESYRALGDHIARVVFENPVESLDEGGHSLGDLGDPRRPVGDFHRDYIRSNQRLFSAVRNRWIDPLPGNGERFLTSTREYTDLQRQLRQDPRLVDLSSEIYHELFSTATGRESTVPPAERRRAELHAVAQMLQIMEGAWSALGLKGNNDLPVNRGWLNVFHRWASSATFHRLWPILRAEFSPEFVQFCEGELHLVAARPTITRVSTFELDRLTIHPRRDSPRPNTLEFEVASIRHMALEFDREWPSEVDRGRGILDQSRESERLRRELNLDRPLIWLIWQGSRHEGTAGPFACGIMLARRWLGGTAESNDSPTFELLTWVRPAYRSTGLGATCFKPVLDELCRVLGQGRLLIRYPNWGRGSGDRNSRSTWRNFFALHNFKDLRGRDNDLKGNNSDGVDDEFARDMILEFSFGGPATG